MKKASLSYKEGVSNKEYHIQLEEKDGKYVVNFQFGRVGNSLQVGTKTPTPVTLEEADKIYTKLLKEKTGKGYIEGSQKDNQYFEVINPSARKEIIIAPQLLNPIEEDEVEKYINDDDWLMQPKMDGNRLVISSLSNKIIGSNKKGIEISLHKNIVKSISGNPCVIDGELVGDIIYVFDLLSCDGKPIQERPLSLRLELLSTLHFGSSIKKVRTAYSTLQKVEMYQRLKAENAEGIVFKKKSSAYTPGRPASGGNQLKFKFLKSCTCIVSEHTKNKRSVGVEMINGNKRISMGKVSVPINHEIPQINDLIEVSYLYCYPNGGSLFQPTYKGKRVDSDLTDCDISQIVYKAETIKH